MDTEEPLEPKKEKRDLWDKIQIIMHPIGGLITALTIALVSYYGSSYLNNKQNNDSKIRLYTELMSSREQAESALRKDMFNSILGTILKDSHSLDENILQLELLAYNFHESLNLMPLFVYLNRQITTEKNIQLKEEYRKRLYKMAGMLLQSKFRVSKALLQGRRCLLLSRVIQSITNRVFPRNWPLTGKIQKMFYDTVKCWKNQKCV